MSDALWPLEKIYHQCLQCRESIFMESSLREQVKFLPCNSYLITYSKAFYLLIENHESSYPFFLRYSQFYLIIDGILLIKPLSSLYFRQLQAYMNLEGDYRCFLCYLQVPKLKARTLNFYKRIVFKFWIC